MNENLNNFCQVLNDKPCEEQIQYYNKLLPKDREFLINASVVIKNLKEYVKDNVYKRAENILLLANNCKEKQKIKPISKKFQPLPENKNKLIKIKEIPISENKELDELLKNDIIEQKSEEVNDNVLNNLLKLLKTKKIDNVFSVPKIYSNSVFEKEDKNTAISKYAVYNKIDGERKILYIENKIIWSLNIFGKNVSKIELSHNLPSNTILDCDVLKNVYFIRDVLFINGVDYRPYSFDYRIHIIRQYNLPENIKLIKSLSNGDLYYDVKLLLTGYDDNINDGMIIIEVEKSYNSGKVYKIKPKKCLFINFMVCINNNNKNLELFLLKDEKDDKLVPYIQNGSVAVLNMTMKNLSKSNISDKNYLNNKIVECLYENNSFDFYKLRTDKKNPDTFKSATEIIENVKNAKYPETLQDFLQLLPRSKNDICLVENFQNSYKRRLINCFASESVLSVNNEQKYKNELNYYNYSRRTKEVYVVNPNKTTIMDMKKFVEDKKYDFKVELLPIPIQNTTEIQKHINSVNVISMFNILSDFFSSKEKLLSLVYTIDELLKVNGILFGIDLEGDKIIELLNSKKEFKNSLFSIKIENDIDLSKFGNYIDLNLGGKTHKHLQNATNLQDFAKILEERGILLITAGKLFNQKEYPKDVIEYNKLFKFFIFKRKEKKENVNKISFSHEKEKVVEEKEVVEEKIEKTTINIEDVDDDEWIVKAKEFLIKNGFDEDDIEEIFLKDKQKVVYVRGKNLKKHNINKFGFWIKTANAYSIPKRVILEGKTRDEFLKEKKNEKTEKVKVEEVAEEKKEKPEKTEKPKVEKNIDWIDKTTKYLLKNGVDVNRLDIFLKEDQNVVYVKGKDGQKIADQNMKKYGYYNGTLKEYKIPKFNILKDKTREDKKEDVEKEKPEITTETKPEETEIEKTEDEKEKEKLYEKLKNLKYDINNVKIVDKKAFFQIEGLPTTEKDKSKLKENSIVFQLGYYWFKKKFDISKVEVKEDKNRKGYKASSATTTRQRKEKVNYDKKYQKYETPSIFSPLAIFYITLYISNPSSPMAIKWLTEYGIYDGEKRNELIKKYAKL